MVAQGRLRLENIRAGAGGPKPPTHAFPDVYAYDLVGPQEQVGGITWQQHCSLAGLLARRGPHAAWWA